MHGSAPHAAVRVEECMEIQGQRRAGLRCCFTDNVLAHDRIYARCHVELDVPDTWPTRGECVTPRGQREMVVVWLEGGACYYKEVGGGWGNGWTYELDPSGENAVTAIPCSLAKRMSCVCCR